MPADSTSIQPAPQATATTAIPLRTDSDTVAASALQRVDAPWIVAARSRLVDAPMAVGAERPTSTGIIPYMRGLEPTPRAVLPGYDSSVMTLLIVVFLFLSMNFRNYGTFLSNYARSLWKERRRDSFYEVHTFGETRVLLSLVLLTTVCEGVMAFASVSYHGFVAPGRMFSTLMTVVAGAMIYYVAQVAAYQTVGYIFADKEKTIQWVRGFNASQAFLGLGLAIPALLVLFNPGATPSLLAISIVLYLSARIIFICKGFRLFYDNFGSLLYFILYLCALEIIPLILICKII